MRSSTGISFGASAFYYLHKSFAKAHQLFYYTNVILFVDNTSILITEKNYAILNQKIRFTLDFTSKWFKAKQLVLNLMKTNVIKYSPLYFLQSQMINEHNNTSINEVPDTKFLGVKIDNRLNWECHIDRILPKLITAGFVIKTVILCTKYANVINGILCLLSFNHQIWNYILG